MENVFRSILENSATRDLKDWLVPLCVFFQQQAIDHHVGSELGDQFALLDDLLEGRAGKCVSVSVFLMFWSFVVIAKLWRFALKQMCESDGDTDQFKSLLQQVKMFSDRMTNSELLAHFEFAKNPSLLFDPCESPQDAVMNHLIKKFQWVSTSEELLKRSKEYVITDDMRRSLSSPPKEQNVNKSTPSKVKQVIRNLR